MATKFGPVSSLPPSVFPPVFAGHYRYYPRFLDGVLDRFRTNASFFRSVD